MLEGPNKPIEGILCDNSHISSDLSSEQFNTSRFNLYCCLPGYVTDILDDAKVYCSHANKKNIDVDDVKLAIQCRLDHSFTTPPPRDVSAFSCRGLYTAGLRLNIKTVFPRYGDSHVKD